MASNPLTLTMSPVGVLCFAESLFVAKAATKEQPDKTRYSAIIGFDKEAMATSQYQSLRAAVSAAMSDKFGAVKAADPVFVRTLRLPFRAAAEKDYAGFDAFDVFINPWLDGKKDPRRSWTSSATTCCRATCGPASWPA